MDNAFSMSIGLGIAIVAVYLLKAVNFQIWGDPLVIIAALPIVFCGILTSLLVMQMTLSTPRCSKRS